MASVPTPLPNVARRTLLHVLGGVLVMVASAILIVAWVVTMPGTSFTGEPPPLSADDQALAARLRHHVDRLGGTATAAVGLRSLGRGDPALAERYVTEAFESLGSSPRRLPYRVSGIEVANVEVTLAGTASPKDVVLVGAHYDAAEETRGADDNASGVAALLELARVFTGHPQPLTLRFVAFVNEEPPYFQTDRMGSVVYAEAAEARGDRIRAMLSLESIGYYSSAPKSQRYPAPFGALYPDRGDFVAFVSDLGSRGLLTRALEEFRKTATIPSEGLAAPSFVPGIGWSDHWAFSMSGYPAIMITDTAIFRSSHYHRPSDTAEKLDYARMARVVRGLEPVLTTLAAEAPPRRGRAP